MTTVAGVPPFHAGGTRAELSGFSGGGRTATESHLGSGAANQLGPPVRLQPVVRRWQATLCSVTNNFELGAPIHTG
jgi:hypothetical protein